MMALLKKRKVAISCMVFLILCALLIGTRVGLKKLYRQAENIFYNGEENDGVSIQKDLNVRLEQAANLQKIASRYTIDTTHLQSLIDDMKKATDSKSKYDINTQLTEETQHINNLLENEESIRETDHTYQIKIMSELESRNLTISYDHAYNDATEKYNDALHSFPANIIAGITGMDELELFR